MEPSPWVVRFAPLVAAGGAVLDVAAGAGRHTRLFLERGHPVVAVDRDVSALTAHPRLKIVEADLEDGSPIPAALAAGGFAGVVVTRYLHRPLLGPIVAAVAPGGILIYETFAAGQERLGRPTNPDFLLRPGELFDAVAGDLRVLAYEDLTVSEPEPAAIQRICAQRPSSRRAQRQGLCI